MEERLAAIVDVPTVAGTPSSPGYRGRPSPAESDACETREPRPGPGSRNWWLGKPTVRRAESLGGKRMSKKQMPAAERQQETAAVVIGPPPVAGDNWPDTGPGAWARKRADVDR